MFPCILPLGFRFCSLFELLKPMGSGSVEGHHSCKSVITSGPHVGVHDIVEDLLYFLFYLLLQSATES